jgi:hypothetical protein
VVVLSMLLLVIHCPHYLSHLFPLMDVTFWTQSSMKSLKAQPLSFWYCNGKPHHLAVCNLWSLWCNSFCYAS